MRNETTYKTLSYILIICLMITVTMMVWMHKQTSDTIDAFKQAQQTWLSERLELEGKIDALRRELK